MTKDDQPALPAPESLPSDEIGHGQSLVVILLAMVAIVPVVFILTFVLPPGFLAASFAFGPVILIALCVWIAHIRSHGLKNGEPP